MGLYRCQDNILNGICDDQTQFAMPYIEGLESMQVRYGIRIGNTIQFVTTTNPNFNQNANIAAIRINLLMRTPHLRRNLNTTNQDFYLDGPNLPYNPYTTLDGFGEGPEAGYRHRLFTATIAVRNS